MVNSVIDTPAKNRFCGPAAISAISGVSSGYAAALARRITGERAVKGMHTGTLRRVLVDIGFEVSEVHLLGEQPTLIGFLRARSPELRRATLVIVAANHFVAVQGRQIVDSGAFCGTRSPIAISDLPKGRRARVTRVLVVRLRDPQALEKARQESRQGPQRAAPKVDRRLRARAKAAGFVWERSCGEYWVYAPPGMRFSDGPDAHFCYDAAELDEWLAFGLAEGGLEPDLEEDEAA